MQVTAYKISLITKTNIIWKLQTKSWFDKIKPNNTYILNMFYKSSSGPVCNPKIRFNIIFTVHSGYSILNRKVFMFLIDKITSCVTYTQYVDLDNVVDK